MTGSDITQSEALDPQHVLAIVVGSGLEAETIDRPLAYDLQDRIRCWQERAGRGGLIPVVCSDLWYLNDPQLRHRPTISIGNPEVNAVSAYLGSRLPTAMVIEDALRIQLDLEYVDLQACVWGVDHQITAQGIQLFQQRFMEPFLEQCHEDVPDLKRAASA